MDYFELREALASFAKPSVEDEDKRAQAVEKKPDHIRRQEVELYYLDEGEVLDGELAEAIRKRETLVKKRKETKSKKAKILINPSKTDI